MSKTKWISELYELSKKTPIITNTELTNFSILTNTSLEYVEAMYEIIRKKQLDTFSYDDDSSYIYTFLLIELYKLNQRPNESFQDTFIHASDFLSISKEAIKYHYETVQMYLNKLTSK